MMGRQGAAQAAGDGGQEAAQAAEDGKAGSSTGSRGWEVKG